MKYHTGFLPSSILFVLVSVLSFLCEGKTTEGSESGNGIAVTEIVQLPPGMHMDVFADESLVANPVAFSIDEMGQVFVCETFAKAKGSKIIGNISYGLKMILQHRVLPIG